MLIKLVLLVLTNILNQQQANRGPIKVFWAYANMQLNVSVRHGARQQAHKLINLEEAYIKSIENHLD